MKILVFLLTALMPITNINKPKVQDYIQIQYTGVEQYSSKQAFIVKRSVDFQTIENRLDELGLHATPPLSRKNKELIWERMFNTFITDDRTFSKIIGFIDKNSMFFDGKERSKFSIIVNGSRHQIILNTQKEFFNKLSEYLTSKNCDKVVINLISSYEK